MDRTSSLCREWSRSCGLTVWDAEFVVVRQRWRIGVASFRSSLGTRSMSRRTTPTRTIVPGCVTCSTTQLRRRSKKGGTS